MTRAAVVSFWHPLRPIPASTKRGVPSALQGVACTMSPSSWAIARPRGARWSAGFVPQCTRARFPPCWAPPPGATSEAAARPHPRRPRADSRRCGARVEPGSRTSPAPARRGGGSLPALVGPCTLRAPGQPSPRSWRHDGARAQCVVARARPDAPGQSPAPPHQRLYLRRGWGLGCRPPWASPDLLRDRLRLSHRA